MAHQRSWYFVPILTVLFETSPLRTADLCQRVYAMTEFTQDDLEDMGYGHDRRYKTLNWAKTALKDQGLVRQVRHGCWAITEQGVVYLHSMGGV